MTYAGIGSRETPNDILVEMSKVSKYLEKLGYTLRSGGAKGADQAFEEDIKNKEIFLATKPASPETLAIAREIHPAPEAIDNAKNKKGESSAAFIWNIMARNTNQVFGENLDTPVDFVLAWTKDGKVGYGTDRAAGGTGQAIEMAARKGIPVINMFNSNWKEELERVLKNNVAVAQAPTVQQPEISPREMMQLELGALEKQLKDLEFEAEQMSENVLELIVAKELPKILPESASAETGGRVGNDGDVNTSLLSKSGETVQQAAHNIWENLVNKDGVDTEVIRDIIIDILTMGKKAFIDKHSTTEEIEDVKQKIKDLKEALKPEQKPKEVKQKAPKKVKKDVTFEEPQQLDLFADVTEAPVEEVEEEPTVSVEDDIEESSPDFTEEIDTSAPELSAVEKDLLNLNITFDVADYLYENSRAYAQNTMDFTEYRKEVMKLINNLRSQHTNEEIVEKIKCL